ncbi:MAG: choice-of-anchor B family protein [Lewinellaceae bacterium]|nr:choice-of-anchor B family protein [Saprospiraceae bacterium]MCB9340150.1 choice-of-anchor B family protein [Lewinellaceae bacterium]
MKKTVVLLLFPFLSFAAAAQLNMTFAGSYQYDQELSDIWGYAAPDGTEYALVGVYDGVSIVNLADPSNPVESDFIPGASSTWRDIKTWGHYAYVTNETADGLLVIDLSGLPGQVSYFNWTPNISGLGALARCHNLWIDEFGYIYLSGSNLNNGGLLFIDVATDPWNPVYVGKGPAEYSHDTYVRDNIAYSAEINIGEFGVYNVADKGNPVKLASQSTPGVTTHNLWLSDDSSILFTTDETGNAPVAAYDISDLNNIVELDQFRPLETLGEGVIPHNVHVWDDWLIISYYTDGCILVDGSNPENLIEVGNFDTYIPASTGFAGAWGAYPFLPSGLVLVTDIENGLYILEPNYVRACYLEGTVTDQLGSPVFDATVDIVGETAFDKSSLTGKYKTGLAIAGTYDVEAKKPGYFPATATVQLENGVLTLQDFELVPLPSFSFSGTVKDAATGEAIEGAAVKIENGDFVYELESGPSGEFTLPSFFQGNYSIAAGKWGYRTIILSSQDIDENNNAVSLELETGIEDIFSLDLGWIQSGSAIQAPFELGNPIGVYPPQTITYLIQPEDDVDADDGNSCYITGNISSVSDGVQISGITRITSPKFDLTGMGKPMVSYYTWLFTAFINGPPAPGNDDLLVKITNGIETVVLENISFTDLLSPPAWTYSEISVADTILPTANMRMIFEIGDNDPTFSDIAEAGVDYFRAWDADPISGVKDNRFVLGELEVFPNPSAGLFYAKFDRELLNESTKLLVMNTLGQVVEEKDLPMTLGEVSFGSGLEKGVYWVKIQNGSSGSLPVKVLKH